MFYSYRQGGGLFSKAADGTGGVEQLTESANAQYPSALSADENVLLFAMNDGQGTWMLSFQGERIARRLVGMPLVGGAPKLAPNGKWLALESNGQVFVTPFPNVSDGLWPITSSGGTDVRWAPSGREIFYQDSQGRIVAVEVETESNFVVGRADILVDGPDNPSEGLGQNYDVDTDAERFLMVKEMSETDDGSSASITVVLNWFEELKARVPIP